MRVKFVKTAELGLTFLVHGVVVPSHGLSKRNYKGWFPVSMNEMENAN